MDELPRGTTVGRYVIIEHIGRGGMGVVYRAYDPELDRALALKLVAADDAEESGAKRDRLLREAQALARLQHPNVIAVHDVGTFRNVVFIAMDFVEGKTLRGWLRDKPRRRRDILDAFVAAGEGLAAAHRAGLVHRDFKPDNVLVGNDGRVRVLDFGLARDAAALPRDPDHVSAPKPLVDSSEVDGTLHARRGAVGDGRSRARGGAGDAGARGVRDRGRARQAAVRRGERVAGQASVARPRHRHWLPRD